MQNQKFETPETIKWKTIKEFVNQLNEEQLEKLAYVVIEDSSTGIFIKEVSLTQQDMYYNTDDDEDSGPLELLKECHGEDFDESKYKLATKEGTPFLWA